MVSIINYDFFFLFKKLGVMTYEWMISVVDFFSQMSCIKQINKK